MTTPTTSTMNYPLNVTRPQMDLNYPMTLGTYADYAGAQRTVDYLADNGFPVQNVSIIGTGLKSVERVVGRLTRRSLAAGAALSGLWMGLFVGIAFSSSGELGFLITTPLLGALFGLIWSQLGFRAATRNGARDFASVSQVVATRYEVLVEHFVAADAQQPLATMPTARPVTMPVTVPTTMPTR